MPHAQMIHVMQLDKMDVGAVRKPRVMLDARADARKLNRRNVIHKRDDVRIAQGRAVIRQPRVRRSEFKRFIRGLIGCRIGDAERRPRDVRHAHVQPHEMRIRDLTAQIARHRGQ